MFASNLNLRGISCYEVALYRWELEISAYFLSDPANHAKLLHKYPAHVKNTISQLNYLRQLCIISCMIKSARIPRTSFEISCQTENTFISSSPSVPGRRLLILECYTSSGTDILRQSMQANPVSLHHWVYFADPKIDYLSTH
jgi:hypothetical protein